MSDLPPWHAQNEKDNEEMRRWVNLKLDELFKTAMESFQSPNRLAEMDRWSEGDEPELYAARHGNLEPLRKKYPLFAPFLNYPTLGQRGKYLRPRVDDPLTSAAKDVPRIRSLWLTFYGKKNRSSGQLSAEDIAAERWDVDASDVAETLKHIPRP
jgi:hypothetical protein